MATSHINNDIKNIKKLNDFLQLCKVEKGSKYTHTTMGKNAGSYFIKDEYLEQFYNLYNRDLLNGKSIYLTEGHPEVSPVVIDIDLRFNLDEEHRKYNNTHIIEILKLYYKYFRYYLDIEDKNMIAFVFEREKPYISSGKTKDGIHIIFPFIGVNKSIQYVVRENVIKNSGGILCDLSSLNSMQDIFDKAVINGNWIMYLSRKPNCKPYNLTYIYDSNMNEIDIESYNPIELPSILSIRKPIELTPFKEGKEDEMKSELEGFNIKKTTIKLGPKPFKKLLLDQLDIIKQLVDTLSIERANNEVSWMEVGWCLYNLDSDKLLLDWIKFSKKSEKFKSGECEKLWSNFQYGTLGMGSLKMWARLDNLELYNEIISKDISNYIMQNDSGTNYEVAKLLYLLYSHQFTCAAYKIKLWFKFEKHRWEEDDDGVSLRSKISTEIVNEYLKVSKYYLNKATEIDTEDKNKWLEKSTKINKLIAKLQTSKFKDDVMKECRELFLNKKFLDKLDENRDLIGFENGVYDLNDEKFREGRPEDYVSYSAKINYKVFKKNDTFYVEVINFVNQIAPKEEMKNYLLLLLASYLQGHTSDEKFHIWTGTGANGKSKIVELFESAFGDYCIKFPITLLTQKRSSSNAANPEVARSKGKRFGTFQEPDENSQINVGYMKELSGGDKITCRALFKEPIDFKPQFKLLLICNHLPKIPSNDGGTWRRLRVFEFMAKFVDNPDPDKPYQFKKDKHLSQKLDKWKEAFMYLLIEEFKKYKANGLIEPEEVIKYTNQYQQTCDVFLEFINEKTRPADNKKHIYILSLYNTFKLWYRDAYSGSKCPQRKDLKAYMDTKYVKHKTTGWEGLEIIIGDDETDDDELDEITQNL